MIKAFNDDANSILISDDNCFISTYEKQIYKINLKVYILNKTYSKS